MTPADRPEPAVEWQVVVGDPRTPTAVLDRFGNEQCARSYVREAGSLVANERDAGPAGWNSDQRPVFVRSYRPAMPLGDRPSAQEVRAGGD